MPVSRTKKGGNFPGEPPVNAIALLKEENLKQVAGRQLRKMSPHRRRKLTLSERQSKALCGEEHNPRYETVTELAKADPVIRAKIIIDCLPDDLVLRTAHLRWDDADDQVEFTRIVLRSLVNLE